MPNSLYSARNRQLGIFVTPQHYGAVGNGIADDTAPWDAFQAAPSVLKAVPAGRYLVSGSVLRFDKGVIGNGVYDDTIATWDQSLGDRERDSLIVHGRTLDANATLVSPAVKIQTLVNYEVPSPAPASFKRAINNLSDMRLTGYYNIATDTNQNFTADVTTVSNDMAGLFGSLAHAFYSNDATETENPLISTMGATKNGCLFLSNTRRALYASGGYMFGIESYFVNDADEGASLPYTNNDSYAFTCWTTNAKFTGGGNAPISSAILMHGLGGKYGYWNAIVIGGSMWEFDGDNQGYAGTVAINGASHSAANGFSDIFVKFGRNNRHTYFKEGHKSRASLTRFMYDAGDCGVAIEAASGSAPYLHFRTGATTAADGGSVVTQGQIDSNASWTRMQSSAGEVQLSASNGAAIYKATSARFAPDADGTLMLGGASNRWNTVYASTGVINTSDERAKTDIADLPDAVLDAWGDVGFTAYRFRDALRPRAKRRASTQVLLRSGLWLHLQSTAWTQLNGACSAMTSGTRCRKALRLFARL